MTRKEMACLIDHTLLSPVALPKDIERLCAEAIEWHFHSVCVSPCHVDFVREKLEPCSAEARPHICTVIGFPLGTASTDAKACETRRAVTDGACELDMVMNIGWFKAGLTESVSAEISTIAHAASSVLHGGKKPILKVIIETCYLDDSEKALASKLACDAGADFIKTSTGFGPSGANVKDIELIRKTVGPNMGIKASGGIKTASFALELIEAGATRIGTSSGVTIIKQLPE